MTELSADLRLAHVLFIDIVGSSKLLINEQSELLRCLTEIVRNTAQVRDAESSGKLIRLPTGDGMALAFFTSPDAPVRCAMEIATALKQRPDIPLRMGINSGPVDEVVDVSGRSNIAGAGITIAQRVMDSGDAGHILVSKRIADDLGQYATWRQHLHSLGECEVKHGMKIDIYNFYTGEIGNPAAPEKLKKAKVTARPQRLSRGMIAAVLVLIAGVIGFVLFQNAHRSIVAPAAISHKQIAVLPFKPLSAEPRDEALELGMADSLITKLSNSKEIVVRSLTSVRKFIGLDQDPVTAGRELQVNAVLEGNVQKSGDHIRVTARLINVDDGSSVWAGAFDEKFTDVFAVEDAISQKVADALAVRLTGEEKQRLTRHYTESTEAYQLFLTGRFHYAKLIPLEIRTSIGFFQQAIEKDPNYALAYFGLAEANSALAMTSDVPSKDCLPQAKATAKKALEIDDSLADAHAALATSLIWYDWDWAGGEREAKRAIALNPNSAHARFVYADLLSDEARHDQALIEIARARQLDPIDLLYSALEGMDFHHARRDVEALARLQKALDLDQNFWVTHLILGYVYTQQRKYPEAIAAFNKTKELSHGNSESIGSIGYVAGLTGDKTAAQAVLDELKTRSAQAYIPPCSVALVYNGLGNQTEAIRQLEKAVDDRDVKLSFLKVDPRWDSFRSNPQFMAILKRIGLQ
jgi:TolB-like protein/Tfp pilus assembly protein PilF